MRQLVAGRVYMCMGSFFRLRFFSIPSRFFFAAKERYELGYYCIWDIKIFFIVNCFIRQRVCVRARHVAKTFCCEWQGDLPTALFFACMFLFLSSFFPLLLLLLLVLLTIPKQTNNSNEKKLGTAVECLSIYVNWPHKLIFFPLLKSTLLNEYGLWNGRENSIQLLRSIGFSNLMLCAHTAHTPLPIAIASQRMIVCEG